MSTRRSLAVPVSCGAALLCAVALAPLQAQERDVDTLAPIVEIEALDEGTAGTTQTFTAQVADDGELAGVTLHHRRTGEQPFVRVAMDRRGQSNYHDVSLATEPDDLRAIEYYVQAIDESGNRTVSGFAFDPRIRTLVARGRAAAAPPVAPTEPAAPPIAESSGGPRWWAVALGVLAVGAIASLAGGGGGDSGGDGTVPLTIDLPEPATR